MKDDDAPPNVEEATNIPPPTPASLPETKLSPTITLTAWFAITYSPPPDSVALLFTALSWVTVMCGTLCVDPDSTSETAPPFAAHRQSQLQHVFMQLVASACNTTDRRTSTHERTTRTYNGVPLTLQWARNTPVPNEPAAQLCTVMFRRVIGLAYQSAMLYTVKGELVEFTPRTSRSSTVTVLSEMSEPSISSKMVTPAVHRTIKIY